MIIQTYNRALYLLNESLFQLICEIPKLFKLRQEPRNKMFEIKFLLDSDYFNYVTGSYLLQYSV